MALARDLLSKNLAPIKKVRSFAGKCSHVAGLILYWRPFVAMVWAALTSPHSDGSPEGLIWTKRFAIGVGWILLFLARTKGTLVRTYFLSTWRHEGPSYHIELDASPWGLGGILFYQGTPI
eukprot:3208439-Amphidinium_carterae.1